MSIPEVAQFLGVPEKTVRKWRHEGTGPRSLKIGRHVRYRPEDLESWIEGREQHLDQSA